MKTWAFEYCACTYESAFGMMSIHKTRAGAYKAKREHALEQWALWKASLDEMRQGDDKDFLYACRRIYDHPFDHERSRVRLITLLD